MKIKELYIENFGKLSKFKLTCSDGLNSFTEDNGYGKTTLSVFIKTMFYGFDDTRRQSLDENDRKKHTPWQGGAFGGYLVYEKDGTAYRIERTFGTKAAEDTFRLYNLNTGRAVVSSQTSLGEELFGIDRDGFERTVFLSEKNLSVKNTNQSISAKLSNLVGANGDIGDFDDAIKLLDERRKFYQKRGGAGEIRDVVDEISALEYKIKSLTEKQKICAESALAISTLNERIAALKRKKEGVIEKERKEKLEREKRSFEIQYGEMLGALKIDEARERELLEFFEKKFPTNAEIALADTAMTGNVGNAHIAVLLQKIDAVTNAGEFVFGGSTAAFLTNGGENSVDHRVDLGDADDIFFELLRKCFDRHSQRDIHVFEANAGHHGGGNILSVFVGHLKMDDNGVCRVGGGIMKIHHVFRVFCHICQLIAANLGHVSVLVGDGGRAVFEPEQSVGKLWLAEGVIYVAAAIPVLRLGDRIADIKFAVIQFFKGDDLHVALLSYKRKITAFSLL